MRAALRRLLDRIEGTNPDLVSDVLAEEHARSAEERAIARHTQAALDNVRSMYFEMQTSWAKEKERAEHAEEQASRAEDKAARLTEQTNILGQELDDVVEHAERAIQRAESDARRYRIAWLSARTRARHARTERDEYEALAAWELSRAHRAEVERDETRARLTRVHQLHVLRNEIAGHCAACHRPYPCPTLRALDEEARDG